MNPAPPHPSSPPRHSPVQCFNGEITHRKMEKKMNMLKDSRLVRMVPVLTCHTSVFLSAWKTLINVKSIKSRVVRSHLYYQEINLQILSTITINFTISVSSQIPWMFFWSRMSVTEIFSMFRVGCLRTFCVATILMLKRGSHSCMGSGSLPIRRKPLYLFDEFFEILSWFVILISKWETKWIIGATVVTDWSVCCWIREVWPLLIVITSNSCLLNFCVNSKTYYIETVTIH